MMGMMIRSKATLWYANVAFSAEFAGRYDNISHYWKNDWLVDMQDMRDSDLLDNSVASSAVATSKSAAR